MASFMSYFGARRDPKQSARDAIVTLRQQLQLIEKKEEYLQKKIDEELKKAKLNAVTNKNGASALCLAWSSTDARRNGSLNSCDGRPSPEESERTGTRPPGGYTAAARDAGQHARIRQPKRRDNGRHEEGVRRT